jgi:hypothetical protein
MRTNAKEENSSADGINDGEQRYEHITPSG